MNAKIATLLLFGLGLSGCLAEVATTTAITGTLQAQQLGAMQRQVQGAAESTGKVNLERALSTYKAEKGSNPPNLDALAPGWIPAVPIHPDGSPYGYDPGTGTLFNSPIDAARAIDQRSIQRIQQAINQYGTTVGFYPPTLDALVPTYLPETPRSATGEPFVYNNQNGFVGIPGGTSAAAVPPGQRGGGVIVGGAGPVGETVTAIGVSNQLDNMNSSGSSAAGTRMREGARGAGTNTNDRTNAAMDGLGL